MHWIVGKELSFTWLAEETTWDQDLVQFKQSALRLYLWQDQQLLIQAKEWIVVEHLKKSLII
jgi:hypothetical protein